MNYYEEIKNTLLKNEIYKKIRKGDETNEKMSKKP